MLTARIAALSLLMVVGTALAVYPPPVKDEAKVFSAAALKAANEKIRAIYEKYHKDVVVETLPSLTAEQERSLEREEKSKFFPKLALERSRAVGLDGVYVLIVKKPSYLQIHMDPETQKRAFTAANRTTLREKLVARLKEEEWDAGLRDGLDVVAAALEKTTKEAPK